MAPPGRVPVGERAKLQCCKRARPWKGRGRPGRARSRTAAARPFADKPRHRLAVLACGTAGVRARAAALAARRDASCAVPVPPRIALASLSSSVRRTCRWVMACASVPCRPTAHLVAALPPRPCLSGPSALSSASSRDADEGPRRQEVGEDALSRHSDALSRHPGCSNQSDANSCATGLGSATPRQPALSRAELPPPSSCSRAVP